MTESECQRFFALSKRVPKDVKRYCGICRQHGVLLEICGHTCTYKDCNCNKCQLVRTRRQIMTQQIRLRRTQDKRFQRTNEPTKADVVPIKSVNEESASIIATNTNVVVPTSPDELLTDARNMCYFCQKCKNHEILVWKKQHKRQCPFTNCTCEKCELIETRRRFDQHMKKRKASLKAAIEAGITLDESENFTPSPKHSDASTSSTHLASPPASSDALKIDDTFLQQNPMFAIPQPQQLSPPPASLPLFVPAVQPVVTLAGLSIDGGAFSPTMIGKDLLRQTTLTSSLPTPIPLPGQISLPTPVFLSAQPTLTPTLSTQPTLLQPTPAADIFQMIQKTISPLLIPASVSPSLQFLPAVNFLPPVSVAQIQEQPASPTMSQISYKELEQFLMLRHQQKLGFH